MPFLLLVSVIIIITAVMTRPWKLFIVFLGCTVFFPTFARAEEEDFVKIWPEKAVVEYAGTIVLNCSSNCSGITLETTVNAVPEGNGTTWKAFRLTNVSQWVVSPLCSASCGKPSRAQLTVYRVPKHVVLDPVPKMEVGKEYTLTCRVPSVAPIQNLTVTLFKGGKALLVKTYENYAAPEARDVVVTHPITVQKEDLGEEVTCQATLDLRPEGPLFEKTSPRESLTFTGAAEVTLFPQKVAVKQGGSVWLNCSFTCKSTPKVTLETSLQKGRVLRGPGWVSTQLENITKQASLAHCYYTCDGKREKATATILSYGPPEHVFMELEKSSPSQRLHQAYNLTCHVINITPVHNLTVTLLKGEERVHSWRLQNYTRSGPENVTVTHAIALRPHDHGQEAACNVTLDLSTEEQTLIATSSKLELKTPESYRGVMVAIFAIGLLATELMGIVIYYLVLARGSRQL